MLYDDPKAEQFSRDVADAAGKYYATALSGPVFAMTEALRRMWLYTGDQKFSAAATKVEDAMSMLPTEAAHRAGKVYGAFQDWKASDQLHEPLEEHASVLDESALKTVNEAWVTAAELSHTNDSRAVEAQREVGRFARQLEPLLNERGADAYDQAVLDPAAQKYLQ